MSSVNDSSSVVIDFARGRRSDGHSNLLGFQRTPCRLTDNREHSPLVHAAAGSPSFGDDRIANQWADERVGVVLAVLAQQPLAHQHIESPQPGVLIDRRYLNQPLIRNRSFKTEAATSRSDSRGPRR